MPPDRHRKHPSSFRQPLQGPHWLIVWLLLAGEIRAYKINRIGRRHRWSSMNVKSNMRVTANAASQWKHGAQCGRGWQEQYTALHRDMLSRKPEDQRFVVAETYRSGLADRLTSAVPIFYFALLTGRAFRINWKTPENPHTDLSLALDGPSIDWAFQDSDAISGQTQRENWYWNDAWHPPSARDFQVFGGQDLRLFGNGTRTVVFVVNAGTVNHLFYNPHHRQQLFEWGLRPETAVGCALNYLFRPREEVLDLVRDSYKALRDTAALKIGIQVRMGDHWLLSKPFEPRRECDPQIHPPDRARLDRWFQCAEQVEEEYRVGGQEVIWYVVSDCAALRTKAKERYGAKVLVPRGEAPVEHVVHSSGNATRDVLAFRVAFAEQWLLGMTDFQVITEESSFGRLAALRSLRFRSVFTVRSPGGRDAARECVRGNFDTFEVLANSTNLPV